MLLVREHASKSSLRRAAFYQDFRVEAKGLEPSNLLTASL